MGELVEAKSKPIFTKTHELKPILTKLKKVSKKAIEVLEKALTSDDEKIRVAAAEKLLKFYVDTSKEVNQDEMNRLILEIKTSGLIGQGSTVEDNTPVLDFDNLHPQFRDKVEDAINMKDVVDLSQVSKIG